MGEAGQRSRLFGTDGVRGVAGQDLTARLALDLSAAAAAVLGGAVLGGAVRGGAVRGAGVRGTGGVRDVEDVGQSAQASAGLRGMGSRRGAACEQGLRGDDIAASGPGAEQRDRQGVRPEQAQHLDRGEVPLQRPPHQAGNRNLARAHG